MESIPEDLYSRENDIKDFFAENEDLYSEKFQELFAGVNNDICQYMQDNSNCKTFAHGILQKGAH